MSVDEDQQVDSSADVLVSLVRQIEHLEVALDHRTTIGQAQGILMERMQIDSDAAFRYLCRVSSNTNTKVIDIADDIVRTRTVPASA